ncbi:MAG: GNAT family N-acetyltransferase [Treponema sp.]
MQKPIETKRLILRSFTLEDAKNVFEYASDPEVVKYLTWEAHKNIEESIHVIKTFYLNDNTFCIELKDEKKCIGAFELRPKEDIFSFGYVLNRKYWNCGIMTEVLQKMLEISFTTLGAKCFEGAYYEGNEASGAVMKKCGMAYQGIKRKFECKNNIFTEIGYKITLEEYISLKQT